MSRGERDDLVAVPKIERVPHIMLWVERLLICAGMENMYVGKESEYLKKVFPHKIKFLGSMSLAVREQSLGNSSTLK